MKIEATCARRGPHPEYLVRMSHQEVMALGGTTFEPGEELLISDAIDKLETVATQLRYASRAMRAAA